MRLRVAVLSGCIVAWLAATTCSSVAMDKVRTFSQPTFTGFPTYVAQEMGFFKKYDIDASPKFMASGAPILQAAAAGEMDMAFLGAPPAVIGGASLGLITVGMVLEEAPYHQLIGRPDFVAKVEKAGPPALKGAKIFVTTLSTGHYMTEGCLKKLGVSQSDVSIIPSEQPATLSAFATGQGDLAQVWPPQSTVLLQRGNKVLCDAQKADLSIPSVWVVSPAFLKAHPDVAARWLHAHLDAIDWIRADFNRTYELYKKFDAYRGFNLKDDALRTEAKIAMAAIPGSEQLKELAGSNGKPAPLVVSMQSIGEFFKRLGRLKEVPDMNKLVDAKPMEKALGK